MLTLSWIILTVCGLCNLTFADDNLSRVVIVCHSDMTTSIMRTYMIKTRRKIDRGGPRRDLDML
jgi:hypothetical protein